MPVEDKEHAENIGNFALAVRACVSQRIKSPLLDGTTPLALRIGMHTGSCISGVVGTTMPQYCAAGDLIHATYRYERMGLGGKIHCSSDMFGRLQHMSAYGQHDQFYQFTPRGIVQGQHGETCFTYWLDDGTSSNPYASSTAIMELLRQVSDLLSKKKSGAFVRGETASVASGDTAGSTECTDFLEHSFKSSFEEIYPVASTESGLDASPRAALSGSINRHDRYFL